MQAIILQIVGLLIITTLMVLFFSKNNIETKETKLYTKLIWLNFLFLIIGISTYIVAILIGNINIINILQKTYMIILTLLNLNSMYYCLSVYDKEDKLTLTKKILFIITIISIILIIFLPLKVIHEKDLLDGEGLSYDVAIIHTIFSFVFFIFITIKFITKRYSIKKLSPFIILIILYLVGFLIRGYCKELIFEGFFYAYILFIMYNTIENPDVKLYKELSFQKKLNETYSAKTLMLIEDMSKELMSSIENLELISNTKVDKTNIAELNSVLSNFQENSVDICNKIIDVLDLATIKSSYKIEPYKYETKDMIDKLTSFLNLENKKITIKVTNNLPLVLYGDEQRVIKTVLYFYNFILSAIEKEKLLLEIDNIIVGNYSRLKFKFTTSNNNILNNLEVDKKDKSLKLAKTTNLDLEIIERLLEKDNGKITITKDKENTTIILSVNQKLESEYVIVSNKKENKNIKIKYHNYKDKRVLLVDNNIQRLKELKVLLLPYKLEVVFAKNINEMTNILSNNKTFDLIFIDDIIPPTNSTTQDLIKNHNIKNLIKKEAKYEVPIITMVTQNNKNYEQKYLDLGFNDYIIKPINKNSLDEIVNKYLKNN